MTPLFAAAAPGTATLLVELGAVIVVLAVLARVAGRLGVSPIPLYLLAGLAVGEGGVVELVTAEGFIEVGGEIGVVLLLLMLGLDYEARELIEGLRRSAPAGLVDVAANALPGVVAGWLLGLEPLDWLLLAGVTWISSSGIIAKVLEELGRLANRETPAVLAVLVIEDLAMAVYLPIVAVLLLGGSLGAAVASVTVALVAVAVVLVVADRYGGPISRVVFAGRSSEEILLAVLGVALVVAGVAERVGISAAVGAFGVGLMVSGPTARGARQILGPLRDLFAGLFFVLFGLRIDPAAVLDNLAPALALAAVGAGTKMLTGWVAAARAGVGVPGRIRAGTALVARGEFSIVIAGLGVAAGRPEQLGALTGAYVLSLAVAGPVLTRFADDLARRLTPARAR